MIYQVHTPTNISPAPSILETSAAQIVAEFLKADVTFIKRNNYAKTADLLIRGQIWEIKSPTGDGKHTMQNNLRKANSQSCNIIMDLRQCKMYPGKAISRLRYELNCANSIKRLIVIRKSGKVLVLK